MKKSHFVETVTDNSHLISKNHAFIQKTPDFAPFILKNVFILVIALTIS